MSKTMINWGPLYIKPLGCKTTEEERRAGYEYAREHLHEIETPDSIGKWAYFTTDPTDKAAKVYSIARPDTGGESSRFGDNAYMAALLEDQARYLTQHDNNARAMASYYAAHEQPEKAAAEHEKARRFNKLAQEHRAAAARIRSQWTR